MIFSRLRHLPLLSLITTEFCQEKPVAAGFANCHADAAPLLMLMLRRHFGMSFDIFAITTPRKALLLLRHDHAAAVILLRRFSLLIATLLLRFI